MYDMLTTCCSAQWYHSAFLVASIGDVTAELADCGIGNFTCNRAKDKICVIARGEIGFLDKVRNCEAGGGVGMGKVFCEELYLIGLFCLALRLILHFSVLISCNEQPPRQMWWCVVWRRNISSSVHLVRNPPWKLCMHSILLTQTLSPFLGSLSVTNSHGRMLKKAMRGGFTANLVVEISPGTWPNKEWLCHHDLLHTLLKSPNDVLGIFAVGEKRNTITSTALQWQVRMFLLWQHWFGAIIPTAPTWRFAMPLLLLLWMWARRVETTTLAMALAKLEELSTTSIWSDVMKETHRNNSKSKLITMKCECEIKYAWKSYERKCLLSWKTLRINCLLSAF